MVVKRLVKGAIKSGIKRALGSNWRSLKAKRQLRDKRGRFVRMNGFGVVTPGNGRKPFAGRVTGWRGDYIDLDGHDGKKYKVHRSKLEMLNNKAHLKDIGVTTDPKAPPSPDDDIYNATEPFAGLTTDLQDVSDFKKVGPKSGSNKGGLYESPDGEQFYIKEIDEDHIKNEVLASRLYTAAGVEVPTVEPVMKDGKLALASVIAPSTGKHIKDLMNDKDFISKVREDFAVDAWAANWDSVGLVGDNILQGSDGNPVRVDGGGALLYRAMGSPKGNAFNSNADEWESMRTSSQGKPVFGNMSDKELQDSAKKLFEVSDEEINMIVNSVGFDEERTNLLQSTLKARRDNILKKAGLDPADVKQGIDSPSYADLDLPEDIDTPEAPDPDVPDTTVASEEALTKPPVKAKMPAGVSDSTTPESEAQTPISQGDPDVPETSSPLDAFPDIKQNTPEAIEGETFPPTHEQQQIIDAVLGGLNTKVQALAGAGKTSSVKMIADRMKKYFPDEHALYIVFNKKNSLEAKEKLPDNVSPMTMHSLAFQMSPKWSKDRIGKQDKSDSGVLHKPLDAADHLNIPGDKTQKLEAYRRAKDIVEEFMKSDHDSITDANIPGHKPGDKLNADQTAALNRAKEIWADLNDPDGVLPYNHSAYLKQFGLTNPDLSNGIPGNKKPTKIFVDEAQDTMPVVQKLLKNQNLQQLWVGDTNQAINGFTGATDALQKVESDVELPLTQSWRFGPHIADVGNRFLQLLGAKNRVKGGSKEKGEVGPIDNPDAILTRTNATVLKEAMAQQALGKTVGVPKGTKSDLDNLVKSVDHLKNGKYKPKNIHQDVQPYDSWSDVAKQSEDGDGVAKKLMSMFNDTDINAIKDTVKKLVEEGDTPSNTNSLLDGVKQSPDGKLTGKTYALNEYLKQGAGGLKTQGYKYDGKSKSWRTDTPEESWAKLENLLNDGFEPTKPDVVITTAHKSKGLEWDNVKIADDFKGPETTVNADGEPHTTMPDKDELMLAYVAATRAKKNLDPGSLAYVFAHTDENGGLPGANAPETTAPETDIDVPETEAKLRAEAEHSDSADIPSDPDNDPTEAPTPDHEETAPSPSAQDEDTTEGQTNDGQQSDSSATTSGTGDSSEPGGEEGGSGGSSDVSGDSTGAGGPGSGSGSEGLGGNLDYSNEKFQPASAKDFHKAIQDTKNDPDGAQVTIYSQAEYETMQTFLSEDGLSGYAISPTGELSSLFNLNKDAKGRGARLAADAIENGATHLNAFDTFLPEIYGKVGFHAAARVKFSDDYAPDGWDYDRYAKYNNGRPDLVFMFANKGAKKPYNKSDVSDDIDYFDDYDVALNYVRQLGEASAAPDVDAPNQDVPEPSTPDTSADVGIAETDVTDAPSLFDGDSLISGFDVDELSDQLDNAKGVTLDEKVADLLGKGGVGTAISQADFDNLPDSEKLYRGSNNPEAVESLYTGDLVYGTGGTGSGIYTTNSKSEAGTYGSNVAEISLTPDARIADGVELEKQRQADLQRALDEGNNLVQFFSGDIAKYAMARGFDGIRMKPIGSSDLDDSAYTLMYTRDKLRVVADIPNTPDTDTPNKPEHITHDLWDPTHGDELDINKTAYEYRKNTIVGDDGGKWFDTDTWEPVDTDELEKLWEANPDTSKYIEKVVENWPTPDTATDTSAPDTDAPDAPKELWSAERDAFLDALSGYKFKETRNPEAYDGAQFFMHSDGNAGYALKDGEVFSIFDINNDPNTLRDLLDDAFGKNATNLEYISGTPLAEAVNGSTFGPVTKLHADQPTVPHHWATSFLDNWSDDDAPDVMYASVLPPADLSHVNNYNAAKFAQKLSLVDQDFTPLPTSERGASGDGYHKSGPWGKFGAAGVLLSHTDDGGTERFLLTKNPDNKKNNPGKWQLPGGALEENENPFNGAGRELSEEIDVPGEVFKNISTSGFDVNESNGWHYTTVHATTADLFDAKANASYETAAAQWLTKGELHDLLQSGELHPGLEETIARKLEGYEPPQGAPIDIPEPKETSLPESVNPKTSLVKDAKPGDKIEFQDGPDGPVDTYTKVKDNDWDYEDSNAGVVIHEHVSDETVAENWHADDDSATFIPKEASDVDADAPDEAPGPPEAISESSEVSEPTTPVDVAKAWVQEQQDQAESAAPERQSPGEKAIAQAKSGDQLVIQDAPGGPYETYTKVKDNDWDYESSDNSNPVHHITDAEVASEWDNEDATFIPKLHLDGDDGDSDTYNPSEVYETIADAEAGDVVQHVPDNDVSTTYTKIDPYTWEAHDTETGEVHPGTYSDDEIVEIWDYDPDAMSFTKKSDTTPNTTPSTNPDWDALPAGHMFDLGEGKSLSKNDDNTWTYEPISEIPLSKEAAQDIWNHYTPEKVFAGKLKHADSETSISRNLAGLGSGDTVSMTYKALNGDDMEFTWIADGTGDGATMLRNITKDKVSGSTTDTDFAAATIAAHKDKDGSQITYTPYGSDTPSPSPSPAPDPEPDVTPDADQPLAEWEQALMEGVEPPNTFAGATTADDIKKILDDAHVGSSYMYNGNGISFYKNEDGSWSTLTGDTKHYSDTISKGIASLLEYDGNVDYTPAYNHPFNENNIADTLDEAPVLTAMKLNAGPKAGTYSKNTLGWYDHDAGSNISYYSMYNRTRKSFLEDPNSIEWFPAPSSEDDDATPEPPLGDITSLQASELIGSSTDVGELSDVLSVMPVGDMITVQRKSSNGKTNYLMAKKNADGTFTTVSPNLYDTEDTPAAMIAEMLHKNITDWAGSDGYNLKYKAADGNLWFIADESTSSQSVPELDTTDLPADLGALDIVNDESMFNNLPIGDKFKVNDWTFVKVGDDTWDIYAISDGKKTEAPVDNATARELIYNDYAMSPDLEHISASDFNKVKDLSDVTMLPTYTVVKNDSTGVTYTKDSPNSWKGSNGIDTITDEDIYGGIVDGQYSEVLDLPKAITLDDVKNAPNGHVYQHISGATYAKDPDNGLWYYTNSSGDKDFGPTQPHLVYDDVTVWAANGNLTQLDPESTTYLDPNNPPTYADVTDTPGKFTKGDTPTTTPQPTGKMTTAWVSDQPIGTALKHKTTGEVYRKIADDKWEAFDADGTPINTTVGDYAFSLYYHADWEATSPVETTHPVPTSLDELNALPVGTTIYADKAKPDGHRYTKLSNGKWRFESNKLSSSEDDWIDTWNIVQSWISQSSNDVGVTLPEGTITSDTPSPPDPDELTVDNIASKVANLEPDASFTYQTKTVNKDENGNWQLVFGTGKVTPKTEKQVVKYLSDKLKAGETVTLNGASGFKIGDYVVVGIDNYSDDKGSGYVTKIDANGILTLKKVWGAPTTVDPSKTAVEKITPHPSALVPGPEQHVPDVPYKLATTDPNPDSEWYQADKPEVPTKVEYAGKFIPDDIYEQMKEGYAANNSGKSLEDSGYYHHVKYFLDTGDTAYPAGVSGKEVNDYKTDDIYDFFVSRKYLTQDQADNLKKEASKLLADKAGVDALNTAYSEKYAQDVKDWAEANGVVGSPLDIRSPNYVPAAYQTDDVFTGLRMEKTEGAEYAKTHGLAFDSSAVTSAELSAIKAYTGNAYRKIQNALLSYQGNLDKLTPKQQKQVKNLDSALLKGGSVTTEPVRLTRFTSFSQLFNMDTGKVITGPDGMQKGARIKQFGYGSSGLDKYGKKVEAANTRIEIIVPAGVTLAHIANISAVPSENEVLIPRNWEMVVHHQKSGPGLPEFLVEMVPTGWTDDYLTKIDKDGIIDVIDDTLTPGPIEEL